MVMGEQTQIQSQSQSQIQTQFLAASSSTASNSASPYKPCSSLPRKSRKLSSNASPKTAASTSTAVAAGCRKDSPQSVARTLSCAGEIDVAIRHLGNSDPKLAPIIDAHDPPKFESFEPPFLALAKSILFQQITHKAGAAIYNRLVSLCGGEARICPISVLALTPPQLLQIGVSARKVSFLHDIANKYRTGILSDSKIVGIADKPLVSLITMVKGFGLSSVHTFMIFSLHRPDVLPFRDINVRKGVQILYTLEQLPRPSQMEQLCERWRPYRSVASWYMWRLVERNGSQAKEDMCIDRLQQLRPLEVVEDGGENLG